MRAGRVSRAVWMAGLIFFGAFLLTVTGASPAVQASFTPASAAAASGVVYHGVNQTQLQECIKKGENCLVVVPGLEHCLKTYQVCNQAAAANAGILSKPVNAGSRLLTAAQVLSDLRIPNPKVKRDTVRFTTYGTLRRQDSALAANSTIAASRPVYLVTVWFAKPVLVSPPVPNGTPSSWYVTSAQYVVDAATGQVTDWGVTK